MADKVFFLLMFSAATVQSSIIPQNYLKTFDVEIINTPEYSYSYDVNDPNTGDIKKQQETRTGSLVQGQYSFIEPDGARRTVDYTADSLHGFNAVVRRDSVESTDTTSSAAVAYHAPETTTTAPTPTTTPVVLESLTESFASDASDSADSKTDSHAVSHVNIKTVHHPAIITHKTRYIATPVLYVPNAPFILPRHPIHSIHH